MASACSIAGWIFCRNASALSAPISSLILSANSSMPSVFMDARSSRNDVTLSIMSFAANINSDCSSTPSLVIIFCTTFFSSWSSACPLSSFAFAESAVVATLVIGSLVLPPYSASLRSLMARLMMSNIIWFFWYRSSFSSLPKCVFCVISCILVLT